MPPYGGGPGPGPGGHHGGYHRFGPMGYGYHAGPGRGIYAPPGPVRSSVGNGNPYEGIKNVTIFSDTKLIFKTNIQKRGILAGTLFAIADFIATPFSELREICALENAERALKAGTITQEQFNYRSIQIQEKQIWRAYNYGYITGEEYNNKLNELEASLNVHENQGPTV